MSFFFTFYEFMNKNRLFTILRETLYNCEHFQVFIMFHGCSENFFELVRNINKSGKKSWKRFLGSMIREHWCWISPMTVFFSILLPNMESNRNSSGFWSNMVIDGLFVFIYSYSFLRIHFVFAFLSPKIWHNHTICNQVSHVPCRYPCKQS